MGGALLATLVMAVGFSLSGLLAPLSRAWALRFGVVDAPGPRKVHDEPTPRMGGLAVYTSFVAVVTTGFVFAPTLSQSGLIHAGFGPAFTALQEAHRVQSKLLALLFGSSIAFAVGLADDVLGNHFHVALKAAGQVLAAVVLVLGGVTTSFLPYEWLNVLLTVLWLVGITNAFNLLDNMDGLCGGVAFVAALVLFLNAWSLEEFFIGLVLVAFMGSLLGFLLFNFFHLGGRRLFLGDCGSLFIGFVLGSFTLLERYVSHASSTLFPVLMPVLVLALPILDTLTVMVIRMKERRPIYVGDSRHLSHRLVSLGLTPRQAVLFLCLATFCLGLGALTLPHASLWRALLILVQCAGFIALLLILLFVERRREARLSAP